MLHELHITDLGVIAEVDLELAETAALRSDAEAADPVAPGASGRARMG